MKADRLSILSLPVSLGLTVAITDFVIHAHHEGIWPETLPALAAPLALFEAGAAVCSLLGLLTGLLAARIWTALDASAAALAGAVAGATPWVLQLLEWRTPPWAESPLKLAVFWAGVVLAVALVAYAMPASRMGTARRTLTALPLVLAGAAAIQILRPLLGLHSRWASSLSALAWLALAVWVFRSLIRRPNQRLVQLAVLGLAGVMAASPLLRGFSTDSSDAVSALGADAPPRRILLITIDTLRRDALGIYSGRPDSPAIDKFAAQAIVFDDARSGAPWTSPAMTSLMTGLTPWTHGVRGQEEYLAEGIPTLAERLRDAGFRTAGIGHNWFLTHRGSGLRMSSGFLEYRFAPILPRPRLAGLSLRMRLGDDPFDFELSTVETARLAEAWLRRCYESSFFLWVHFYDPHGPYFPERDFAPAKEPDPRIGLSFSAADLAEFRAGRLEIDKDQAEWIRALYQAELRSVDREVGRLLDVMRELGAYDDTYVVLTSDHGDEFLEHGGLDHGHTQYDELLRVPLLLKPPGLMEPRRVGARVSTVSLAPTLLEAFDVAYDPKGFATPALPTGSQGAAATAVYSGGMLFGNPLEAVVYDRYKYIVDAAYGVEWLFDLEADPGETRNLAATHLEALETARAMLRKHESEAAELKRRYGVEATPRRPLDQGQRDLLKSLGYIQ